MFNRPIAILSVILNILNIKEEIMKDIRTLWKARAAAKAISSLDLAALCIYKSLLAEEEGLEGASTRLHKAFTPVTNPRKLANGCTPYSTAQSAILFAYRSTVATWLDREDLDKLQARGQAIYQAGFK